MPGKAPPEALRGPIGTLAHNRSFTGRDLYEYTEGKVTVGVVRQLVRAGYLDVIEKGPPTRYFPTRKGWAWIHGRSGDVSRSHRNSRTGNRERLGYAMQHWHSSGGDPIYAVGSYYASNKPYPMAGFAGQHRDGVSVVRAALSRIESYIPQAERGEYGWTKRDAGELRTIARGLRYYLRHDYGVRVDPLTAVAKRAVRYHTRTR